MPCHKNKILIVGGTFDRNNGKPSGLVSKIENHINETYANHETRIVNGGNVEELKRLLAETPNYKFVFWFANVSNDEEKMRNVKEYAPHSLLITSKRNDFIDEEHTKQKYDFEELIQRALAIKANLCFEFCKTEDKVFNIKIFDPLGCVWYNGCDINLAVDACMNRLLYLASVTRKPSIHNDVNFNVDFNAKDREFLEIVTESAHIFHNLMCLPPDVKRFVGNASLRFKQPTRCMNGFPAIRKGELILMSRRNVDKTGITEKDFVPCYLDEEENLNFVGEFKPSVDAPVQLRLFKQFSHIDYILHGHCYIKSAPITSTAVPCGAIEEVEEILKCIDSNGQTLSENYYAINLKGHGCVIMANADTLEMMRGTNFEVRPFPEIFTS